MGKLVRILRALERQQLWILWALALMVRVIYLVMVLAETGFEKLRTFASDSYHYNQIAEYFLTGEPAVEPALLRSGPGYGAMLAIIRSIFGESMIWPILVNILYGSIAPIVVYLLAFRLFGLRKIAMLAGTISCFSLTSIALSSQILTDQPHFTIQCLALLLLVVGYQEGKRRWFILAGIVASLAALIRTCGESWMYLFLLVATITPTLAAFHTKWQMLRKTALASVILLIIVLGWSYRNYVTDGLFTFSTNGVLASRNYLVSLAVAENTPGVDWSQQAKDWAMLDGDGTLPLADSYNNARHRVRQTVLEHPMWVLSTYWKLVMENSTATNHIMHYQIPSMRPFTLAVYRQVESWLGYSLLALSVIGIVCMAIKRHYLAAALLGVTFTYYTLIIGFSFSQGTRLHYPAEMAWSIIVAYLCVYAARGVGKGVRRMQVT